MPWREVTFNINDFIYGTTADEVKNKGGKGAVNIGGGYWVDSTTYNQAWENAQKGTRYATYGFGDFGRSGTSQQRLMIDIQRGIEQRHKADNAAALKAQQEEFQRQQAAQKAEQDRVLAAQKAEQERIRKETERHANYGAAMRSGDLAGDDTLATTISGGSTNIDQSRLSTGGGGSRRRRGRGIGSQLGL